MVIGEGFTYLDRLSFDAYNDGENLSCRPGPIAAVTISTQK